VRDGTLDALRPPPRATGCSTLQRVEMEKRQRSPEEIAKYGPLTEEQMERRAKVRGLLALVSTTNDRKKWMEFVN